MMAHHLMTVCIMCLLCIKHAPCKEHAEIEKIPISELNQSNNSQLNLYTNYDSNLSNNSLEKLNTIVLIKSTSPKMQKRKSLTKRHTGHQHNPADNDSLEKSKHFLDKIFQQFGNPDGVSMNILGFEKMLRKLGLYTLIDEKISNEDLSKKSNTTSNMCISSEELISRMTSNEIRNSHDQKHQHSLTIENSENKNNYTKSKIETILGSNDLHNLCPILLYHLAAPTSLERSGCIQNDFFNYNELITDNIIEEDRFYVWVYAIASTLGVSLVGLLGVAVIPCMDKKFYQYAIQFLVGLAVGTLAGDALLHLLPHSMITFNSDVDPHAVIAFKGLVAVLGIVFLYATERGLTIVAEWRKKIEKKEKPSSRVKVMRNLDSNSLNNGKVGDKLCKHKYSSYPYCYDEIAMDTKDDHHHHHQADSNIRKEKLQPSLNLANKTINNHCYNNKHNNQNDNETEQHLLPHNYTTISDSYSVINKEDINTHDNNGTIRNNLDETKIDGSKDNKLVKQETYTVILREHESSHHGHSHKHGHVHSPPRTLSAVAWMVVMGDGLHNFTDGMAIGAAFSNNIAGGFSTSIAVFCHELPHELGDFAVLLKAGMSAKQAVYYNLLSSVLSFAGMIIGIVVGDTPEASAWIFAIAAGMFLYIALVDMMPELTSAHNEKCAFSQCLLQLLGMCSGLGIMLLIALYEHDLKNMFASQSSHHH